jgi:hypothetical protein
MLRFKQFISEGGNIQIGKVGGDGPKAAPFDSSNRERLQPDIINALHAVHKHVEGIVPGAHIFGKDGSSLKSQGAFDTGSTKMFFDKSIPHKEYAEGIKKTGDIDALIDGKRQPEVQKALTDTKPGTKFGNLTYLGVKHHGGNESSILMKHPDHPEPLQIDLTHSPYENNEPTQEAKDSRRGGSFEDRKMGIKGVRLNQLTHSVAKNVHGMKYSTKGLKAGDAEPSSTGIQNSKAVSKKLFGVEHKDIDSFSGVARLIKQYVPAEHHQAIFDTFKNSLGKDAETSGKPALDHLRKHLGVEG